MLAEMLPTWAERGQVDGTAGGHVGGTDREVDLNRSQSFSCISSLNIQVGSHSAD